MIKKIFSAILFLIAVVGCANIDDDLLSTSIIAYDSNAINFVTQTTKALSGDLSVMEQDSNGFVVYGLEVDNTSWYDYLDGNIYIYDSIAQAWRWSDSLETPSWPVPFSQMNFYAYYPVSASGFTPTATAPHSIIGDIVVQSSILDQTDYLASSSGDVTTKPLTGMQSLNFNHIMSKVSFSVLQNQGILTVIRQLGIENIINEGSYDYINSEWRGLSNTNLGSFDDYVGSSGPFAKYGVEDQIDPIRIDGHYLMLIPQSGGDDDNQTPIWDGSIDVDDSGELVPSGAYISIRYRTSANTDTEDIVGHAYRADSPNETEWDTRSYYYSVYKKSGGIYTGPLFVKAGFKLSPQLLDWLVGSEYDYTLNLTETGGVYLSEYYYDVDGTNTKIRVDGAPDVGDFIFTIDMSVGVSVSDWSYSEAGAYSI